MLNMEDRKPAALVFFAYCVDGSRSVGFRFSRSARALALGRSRSQHRGDLAEDGADA